MTSGTLFLFITIVFSLSEVLGARPNIFIPVTNATCQPEYAWMNNAEQQSPCLTIAYVIAACAGDTWTQPALPSGDSYNSPNSTTATPCYCSWSSYNLMMACTLCQNPAYMSDIATWPSFSQNCPSNYKDEMFPPGYVLLDNASIPYWATINPTNWSSELFNIEQAGNYANQNLSDYWPSTSTPNSNSNSSSSGSSVNIGAIIGGTVGGVVCLSLILIRCYIVYKRRQYRRLHNDVDGVALFPHTGTPMTNTHARWPSDPSTVLGPMPPGSSRPISYMTTQPQGMGVEMSALSPTSYSAFQAMPPPLTETASFMTTGNAAQHTPAIPIV